MMQTTLILSAALFSTVGCEAANTNGFLSTWNLKISEKIRSRMDNQEQENSEGSTRKYHRF